MQCVHVGTSHDTEGSKMKKVHDTEGLRDEKSEKVQEIEGSGTVLAK